MDQEGAALPSDCSWQDQQRRNSSLVRANVGGKWVIRKAYHAEYTAAQEADAYHQLNDLFAEVSGVRLAEVYGVDDAGNAIELEFLTGRDLRVVIAAEGFAGLGPYRERLVTLFAAARDQGVRFDSDPANFIAISKSDELVLVDPVCQDLDLPDLVLVVFLFGLIKAAIAKPQRGWFLGLPRALQAYVTAYCEASASAQPTHIWQQLSDYVGVVIEWNRLPAENESWRLKAFRKLIWVPLLQGGRAWLRFRASAGGRP